MPSAAEAASHTSCSPPASVTTLQNLPVCADCHTTCSPGLMGWLDKSGLMGMSCSGGVLPVPALLPQLMGPTRPSTLHVPGPPRL